MNSDKHSANSRTGKIYTLAQNGTASAKNDVLILNGKGSDLNNGKALKGRAKRKLITQTTALSLVDAAGKNGPTERQKSYWNTYHCQSRVYTADGRLHGKYCKNRHCTLCCSIRKAAIINKYLPVLQAWPDPHFVTLTIRSQPLRNLTKFMGGMNLAFHKIYSNLKKRNQRGKGIKIMGIRALECCFNPKYKIYNPHFHIIVPNKETGEILIAEWLRIWTKKYALRIAQNNERVFNNEIALIEVVKYGSKIFTEPDVNKKIRIKGNQKLYAAALDNILTAMKGLRIFERFGFNLTHTEAKNSSSKLVTVYKEWEFDITQYDWINREGIRLSDYKPEKTLIELLTLNIDTALQ